VAKGAEFAIGPGDTKWLKIYSTEESAYHFDVDGSMKISLRCRW
jgi:hypothetical protein